MYEEFDLGCVPCDEDCIPAPYPTPEIALEARKHCERYADLLESIFEVASHEPDVKFRVKKNPYEDFHYYSVVVRFYSDDAAACRMAIFIENNAPLTWDMPSVTELNRLRLGLDEAERDPAERVENYQQQIERLNGLVENLKMQFAAISDVANHEEPSLDNVVRIYRMAQEGIRMIDFPRESDFQSIIKTENRTVWPRHTAAGASGESNA